MDDKMKQLKRPVHPMPDIVARAPEESGMSDGSAGAARQETRQKRLEQMLDELRDRKLYMKMKYHPR